MRSRPLYLSAQGEIKGPKFHFLPTPDGIPPPLFDAEVLNVLATTLKSGKQSQPVILLLARAMGRGGGKFGVGNPFSTTDSDSPLVSTTEARLDDFQGPPGLGPSGLPSPLLQPRGAHPLRGDWCQAAANQAAVQQSLQLWRSW